MKKEEVEKKEETEKSIVNTYPILFLQVLLLIWNTMGGNPSCYHYGCSEIRIRTSNSDVLVIIKENNEVVRHAYIQANDRYAFSFPNGTYQVFFYYGKGWNPEKDMKNGTMRGGFIAEEHFGKDVPQSLYNSILEYELILQQNGNFRTKPSNSDEAL